MFPEAAKLVDDYNRANGSVHVGAGEAIWSSGGINSGANGLNIESNQLFASGGNGRTVSSFGPDVEVVTELPVLMAESEGYIFIGIRIQEAGTPNWDGYGAIFIRVGPSSYIHQIRRYTNGNSTVLGGTASTTTLAAGDQLGFSAAGKVLKLWRKPSGGAWEELGAREDSTYTEAGPVGIEMTSTTRLDNLLIGTLGAAGTTHVLELSDSVALADAVAKGTTATFSDAVAISETTAKGTSAALSEALGVSDALAKATAHQLADGLSVADGLSKAVAHPEADALALSDSLAKRAEHVVKDTVSINDILSRQIGKGLADIVSVADSLARRVAKALADFIGLSDSIDTGTHSEPASLALADAPATFLAVDDRPAVRVALADQPITYLILEDEPNV